MSKKLIVVESPNKINTIKSYLGSNYDIIASYGHLRELNKKRGYDPETFDPKWQILGSKTKNSKEKIVNEIIQKAKEADEIYIATDPDREGEAIAWHIYDILGTREKEKCSRVTFNEITQKAILNAIKNKHDINMDLVHSQFTRRILDRMIGYKLSTYIKYSLDAISAGRVQSVALLFIVERELERRSFVPTYWWDIKAELDNEIFINFVDFKKQFESYSETSHSTVPFRFANESDAVNVKNNLSDTFKLTNIEKRRESTTNRLTPLTTDKLLQLASINFGWTTSKTTSIVQKLFEGIEINNEHKSLVSYPRTDSERLNDDFLLETKKFIISKYGQEYYMDLASKTKKDNVQDAHEAIRPIDITFTPKKLANYHTLNKDYVKLYNLIWSRTIACLMSPPSLDEYLLVFKNNGYEFVLQHKKITFDGYWILDFFKNMKKEFSKDMPIIQVGQEFKSKNIFLEKHEKSPPPYYTEATLIAALKDSGIGRPSTYSTMAKISESRGYVNKDKQKLIPNELGMNVIEILTKNFSNVISKKFTMNMEEDLDKIASGNEEWKEPLFKFAKTFLTEVDEAYKNTPKKENRVVEDEKCPECNSELLFKKSRFNQEFIACSNFPKCRFTKSINQPKIVENKNCPECNHQLLYKKNKKNQEFIACSNFPECRYIESIPKTYKKEK